MKSINLFIKENVKKIGKHVYVAPEIPKKKLNNAIKAFKCEDFYKSILAIYDDTIFGASDEGLVFTGEKMIFKDGSGEPLVFFYSDIRYVEYIRDISVRKKGKGEYTLIALKNGKKYKLEKPTLGFNHENFVEFLNSIVTEFSEYKEENQLKSISEMPDELKAAYLKIIINMSYLDDGSIDEKELAELFLLATRLEINRNVRFDIRSYISNLSRDTIEPIEKLLEIIKENSEESHHKSLMISLAKDLINVYFSTKNTICRDFEFLDNHKELFNLSDKDIDFAYQAIENDHRLLKYDMDDNAIQKQAKELAAKAAAAGVPLGAVYISGSVVGLSAAGVTSGLAALGLGMGMTGGLAIIGVIGVLSYKGVKHLTGIGERDKYKRKELMLHEVIKQTQKTISLVIDDINYIVEKLNETIAKHSEQREKIKKLAHIVAQYHLALKGLDKKSDAAQNAAMRVRCPKVLDEERLISLTSEATKKPLYDFIMKNYEKETSEDGENRQRLVLKENLDTEILENMAEAFELIGYFDSVNAARSKVTGIAKGFLK